MCVVCAPRSEVAVVHAADAAHAALLYLLRPAGGRPVPQPAGVLGRVHALLRHLVRPPGPSNSYEGVGLISPGGWIDVIHSFIHGQETQKPFTLKFAPLCGLSGQTVAGCMRGGCA